MAVCALSTRAAFPQCSVQQRTSTSVSVQPWRLSLGLQAQEPLRGFCAAVSPAALSVAQSRAADNADTALRAQFLSAAAIQFDDEEDTSAPEALTGGDDAALSRLRQEASEALKQLSPAEMKALRAHAHRMGKDLVTQQVGKWGITPTVVGAMDAALEANEIMKIKVSENSPAEVDEAAAELERQLSARVVGRIGRALLVYRPSMSLLQGTGGSPKRRRRRRG